MEPEMAPRRELASASDRIERRSDRLLIALSADRTVTGSLPPIAPPISPSARVGLILCALAIVSMAASAQATVSTLSFQPSPTEMNDFDHHMVYTRRIDNISLSNAVVEDAIAADRRALIFVVFR
jgi:hypothetical protein